MEGDAHSVHLRASVLRVPVRIPEGFCDHDVGRRIVVALARAPLAVGVILLLALADSSFAQQPGNEPSAILTLYSGLAAAWYARIIPIAISLFWKLVAIDIAYWAIVGAVSGADFHYFTAGIVKKILSVGFWLFLLTNAGSIIPAIVNGLERMGAIASGFQVKLSPSDILSIGHQLAGILDHASYEAGWHTLPTSASLSLTFASWVVFISFAWIAYLLAQYSVYGYLLVAAGSFGMAFGATKWTEQFASRYLAMAIDVGVRLCVLQMMVGAGMFLTANFTGLAQSIPHSQAPAMAARDIAIGSLMFATLIWSVPRFMSSLVSGSIHYTGSEMVAMVSLMAAAGLQAARMAAGAAGSVGSVSAGTGAVSVAQAASMGASNNGAERRA